MIIPLQRDSLSSHCSIQHIIDKIKLILNSLSHWFVNHTLREANFVTHNVVKGTPLNCFEGMIPISSFSSLPNFWLGFQDEDGIDSILL